MGMMGGAGGGGGGGEIDVTDAVNQISEMVQAGLEFGEFQTQQGARFGEQKTEQGIRFAEQKLEQGIRFGEDQLSKGLDYADVRANAALGAAATQAAMSKAELREGYERSQALNAPYRIAAYNALDGVMDTLGMPRLNISSADMANGLEQKAKASGAQERLRAAGTSLMSQLPPGLDPNVAKNAQYALMAGVNPSSITDQLGMAMKEQGLENPMNRDMSATQFERFGPFQRFQFQNSGIEVPKQGEEGGMSSGGGGSSRGGSGGSGGAFGSGMSGLGSLGDIFGGTGSGMSGGIGNKLAELGMNPSGQNTYSWGSLSPNSNSVFNEPQYLNSEFNRPEYMDAKNRAVTAGSGQSMINPLQMYLMNALPAYQDLYRAQMAIPYDQQGIAAALTNGTMSSQPRTVDVF